MPISAAMDANQCPQWALLIGRHCLALASISTTHTIVPIYAHPCYLSVPIHAAYQCPSMPPIRAAYLCPSVPPIRAHPCRLSMPICAAYQCPSVPHISAHHQCPSMPPHRCPSVPPYQCPSVQYHQCPSVKEKTYLFTMFYNRNKKKLFFSTFSVIFLFFLQKINIPEVI